MTLAPKSTVVSIVVVGQMNPAIHHPAWYRFVELINDAELAEALPEPRPLERGAATISIVPAGFRIGAFEISCNPIRWDIRTKSLAGAGRICSVAGRLFDEILPHTPVGAFGLNFEFVFESERRPAGELLADALQRSPFGTGFARPMSGEAKLADKRESYDFGLHARSGEGGQDLVIATNSHYPTLESSPISWSLAEKLKTEFDARAQESESLTTKLANSLLGTI